MLDTVATAQESVTLHIDYSGGQPAVVNREYGDFGYIYIRNGSRGVLEMGQPQYSQRAHDSSRPIQTVLEQLTFIRSR